MTKEEQAIKVLREYQPCVNDYIRGALEVAIKSLEKQIEQENQRNDDRRKNN